MCTSLSLFRVFSSLPRLQNNPCVLYMCTEAASAAMLMKRFHKREKIREKDISAN